jgi:arginyl-tRNA--protein-N-Asp/Glu arginylyltransferase
VTAPVRFPRFFVTSPAPCPYLPGRSERKVFTELKGPNADELNDALGRIGFRRSQTVAYRPSCVECTACVSVRVVTQEFKPSSTQKRIWKRNNDLVVNVCRPWSTPEQFELLQRYLSVRHPGGGMATMDEMDFADMVEHSPVKSYVIEYREPTDDGSVGRLVGACLADEQGDGLSMIYSFYDPQHETRSGLGTFIILDHIQRAAGSACLMCTSATGSRDQNACNTRCASGLWKSLAAMAGSGLNRQNKPALLAALSPRGATVKGLAAWKAASRTAFTARKSATYTSELTLARVIAALLALGAPACAAAQTVTTDQELQALIPDSALDNADAWRLIPMLRERVPRQQP